MGLSEEYTRIVIRYDLDTPTNISQNTAYSLINRAKWGKYEPGWSKGREDMLRNKDL